MFDKIVAILDKVMWRIDKAKITREADLRKDLEMSEVEFLEVALELEESGFSESEKIQERFTSGKGMAVGGINPGTKVSDLVDFIEQELGFKAEKPTIKPLVPFEDELTPKEKFGKGLEFFKKADYEKAVGWFTKAAAQLNTDAKYYLGICYSEGYGVVKDYTKALEFYESAAIWGNVDAQSQVAFCYEKGYYGAPQDYNKALRWYKKAAAQGDFGAQVAVKALKERLAQNESLKPMGIVAVCAGEGLINLFRDLQVDNVIEGGQTMNPSAEDIACAVDTVAAEDVFVFPNNKNIRLAAEQAKEISRRRIHIIPTINIPQGIEAVLAYNPKAGVEENIKKMNDAMEYIRAGAVTYAVRNAQVGNFDLKEGDIIGIDSKSVVAKGDDIDKVTRELISKMTDKNTSNIALYFGEDIKEEEAEALRRQITLDHPRCDIDLYFGGQPFYYYIISIDGCLKTEKKPAEFSKEPTQNTAQADAQSLFNKGIEYYKNKDYSKAVELLTKSAEQGYTKAHNCLGFCYYDGHGVPQDYKKAVECFSKAADQGDANAKEILKKIK